MIRRLWGLGQCNVSRVEEVLTVLAGSLLRILPAVTTRISHVSFYYHTLFHHPTIILASSTSRPLFHHLAAHVRQQGVDIVVTHPVEMAFSLELMKNSRKFRKA